MHQLTYTTSSGYNWNKALPIGNGRLGAMIYGNNTSERFQINEDSVWFGGPRNRNNKDAQAHLEEVRSLILSGNIHLNFYIHFQTHLQNSPNCYHHFYKDRLID